MVAMLKFQYAVRSGADKSSEAHFMMVFLFYYTEYSNLGVFQLLITWLVSLQNDAADAQHIPCRFFNRFVQWDLRLR